MYWTGILPSWIPTCARDVPFWALDLAPQCQIQTFLCFLTFNFIVLQTGFPKVHYLTRKQSSSHSDVVLAVKFVMPLSGLKKIYQRKQMREHKKRFSCSSPSLLATSVLIGVPSFLVSDSHLAVHPKNRADACLPGNRLCCTEEHGDNLCACQWNDALKAYQNKWIFFFFFSSKKYIVYQSLINLGNPVACICRHIWIIIDYADFSEKSSFIFSCKCNRRKMAFDLYTNQYFLLIELCTALL